ncbi:hypothetical protein M422DRAFT_776781 [Sphaerobolus stellatus SS14]|nr:hypothetical protein M422DRAFT_776781 [Sphaerobolus stellatus SS14]
MLSYPLMQLVVLLFSLVLPVVVGQTETVPDPDVAGGSIVEVLTLDPLGLASTLTISSIPPTTSPLSSLTDLAQTTSTTTSPIIPTTPNPGPVGAPPDTTVPVGEGTTIFQYTTIVAGVTEILTGTFTPTFNTLTPPPTPAVGSIVALSDYTASIGTNTVAAARSAAESWRFPANTLKSLATVVVGMVVGAYILL